MKAEIVRLRQAHPTWGGKKLRMLLMRAHGERAPAVRTIERVMREYGLIRARRWRAGFDNSVMRHAIRIQQYLAPDLFKRLHAYAAAQSITVSAVVSAALAKYLDGDDLEEALVVRRLDRVTQAVEQLQRDLDALGIGFGRFVRWSLFATPPVPDDQVIKRGEALYLTFLTRVGEQCRAGVNFTRQVFPPRRSVPAVPAPMNPQEGGREGEGQS